MLENLFLNAIELTVGVSLIAIFILLIQPLTAKFFKRKWRYFVWLILALRLLLPFEFSAPAVVEVTLPQQEIVVTTPQAPVLSDTDFDTTPVLPNENVAERPVVSVRPSVTVKGENEKTVPLMAVFSQVWILVAAAVFLFEIVSHLFFSRSAKRFNRKIEDEALLTAVEQLCAEMNVKRKVRVFRNSKIASPLLIGFFSPKILLPSSTQSLDVDVMILRHELMHLKRGDLFYKLILRVVLALYWFNPVMWVMVKVADNDLENACDEEVVKNKSEDFRHSYCESILKVIRSQKTREPILSAGFSSRPSEIKARFIRILDMTKKRGGKIALVGVLCLALVCSVFIGCELGGLTEALIPTPSDEKVPFSVMQEVERQLEIPLSKDPEMIAEIVNRYSYSEMEIIFEDTRSLEKEIEYVEAGYKEISSEVHKTSLFKLATTSGEKLVLMNTTKSYTHENRLIVSQTVDYITYNDALITSLSNTDFSGAELIMSENCGAYGVYLPKSNSMLLSINDSYRLVEVINQDKNNPLLLNWVQTYPTLSIFAESLSDQFMFASDKKGNNFLVYYDDSEKTVTPFNSAPIGYMDNGDYVSLLSEESGVISISCENEIAFFDLNSANPFTPISVIGKNEIGKEFSPLRMAMQDRNNPNRFALAYKGADNLLGFVTFDGAGNYTYSFDLSGMYIETVNDLNYQPAFVDNIIYFTHATNGYFTREFRKYAVDARSGTGNKPTLQEEVINDDNNVSLEEFDYTRDSKAFPFELDGNVRVMMMMYENLFSVNNNMLNYYIYNVRYTGKTGDLFAKADGNNATLSGKISFSDEGVYFTPENYDYLPTPYDNKTKKVMPILISTNETSALKEYLSSLELDFDNAVVTIKNLIINRVDGVLNYTAEISEIFSGESDFVERNNLALNILKDYGLVCDGEFSITPSQFYANEMVFNSPEMRTSPLSLLNGNGFENVSDLVGWYAAYEFKDEFEKMNFNGLTYLDTRFRKSFVFEADEFESVVTKWFDVSVETLRASEFFDRATNTYRADFTEKYSKTRISKAMNMEFVQFGNTLQIIIHSNSTDTYHHIIVKLNSDGSYKFLKGSSDFYGYETPIVLVTNLCD